MPSNTPEHLERNGEFERRSQGWIEKFTVAGRGVKIAVRTETSFFVHLFITVAVVLIGALLGISRVEWCLIVLSIAVVLSAELFNTSIERIAKAITRAENDELRDALDIASGAVLVVALGAVALGLLTLGAQALELVAG